MPDQLKTAGEAFEDAYVNRHKVAHLASPFVCPYPDCRVYAQHQWGSLSTIDVMVGANTYGQRALAGAEIHAARCASCCRDVLFLNRELILPHASEAPAPAEDLPVEIASEYAEAAAILPGSARGSAALLRLAVQKLLPVLGATKRDINEQIGELVGRGLLPPRVADALDTLRVIGNEAVHPGTIDLNDNREIAMGLFRLLNFIVEKAISEPKHAEQMFALLPQGKRDAIEQRNERAVAANAGGSVAL